MLWLSGIDGTWEATWELTRDPRIMESLQRSEESISQGRVKKWKDIKRDV